MSNLYDIQATSTNGQAIGLDILCLFDFYNLNIVGSVLSAVSKIQNIGRCIKM